MSTEYWQDMTKEQIIALGSRAGIQQLIIIVKTRQLWHWLYLYLLSGTSLTGALDLLFMPFLWANFVTADRVIHCFIMILCTSCYDAIIGTKQMFLVCVVTQTRPLVLYTCEHNCSFVIVKQDLRNSPWVANLVQQNLTTHYNRYWNLNWALSTDCTLWVVVQSQVLH